jgi:hypothetical protein
MPSTGTAEQLQVARFPANQLPTSAIGGIE